MTPRQIKRFGYIPDLPDHRDYKLSLPQVLHSNQLPSKVDLRPQCPKEVYDQDELGSCTANAIAGAIEFDQIKQKLTQFTPSRLMIYYNERVIEGTVNEDSGASPRDGIKSVAKLGACHETLWPYDISRFADKPTADAYSDALQHTALKYERISQNLLLMQNCLYSGFPFVCGFMVFESFQSLTVERSGIVSMPSRNEKDIGGHSVLIVGYDTPNKRFICRNSWGPKWGMAGYFSMPYAYLTNANLADDFWKITLVK